MDREHGPAVEAAQLSAHIEESVQPMSTFGYRLFTVELRKGFGRKPMNFSECDGSHYIDLVPKLLARLAGTRIGRPVMRSSSTSPSQAMIDEPDSAEAEGISGESAFRVEDPLRNEWAITGSIQAGNFGDHEIALGVPGETEDADLLNRAPVRRFRFVFVLPENGVRGVLAIETIGRSCPVELFIKWLSKASQDEAIDNKGAEGDTIATALCWWKIVADQMGDEEHLNELIRSGNFGKVELVKHDVTPDRKRTKEYLRLTAPSIEGGLVSEVASVVRGWWERTRQKAEPDQSAEPITDAEGAQQLAALVIKGVQGLDFDDGWVVLEEDSGRTNRISPSRMSEVFIYPLSVDDRVSDVEFYRRVRSRAVQIGPTVPVEVEWPQVPHLNPPS
ncbi:MAG: hypothetical protein ACRDTH_07705 [Pseudonocardiaceae bacterium]